MFMPPGGLVVEFSGRFDVVSMPVCGYYGPFGAISGHHHFVYAYDLERKDKLEGNRSVEAARLAHAFYAQLQAKPAVVLTGGAIL